MANTILRILHTRQLYSCLRTCTSALLWPLKLIGERRLWRCYTFAGGRFIKGISHRAVPLRVLFSSRSGLPACTLTLPFSASAALVQLW
jgi:hypothetical protein